ncbi:MAG TPA: NrfD/PsrC family molybdoenzyme membrane anchor subunit [Gemmatimonadaceae bacterium]|nr:NrfD/PsrC family molybdoenzyme membrane anchor subunit [Gemmatimonadaceae bacterium]
MEALEGQHAAPGVTPEWRARLERRALAPLAGTGRAYWLWLAGLLAVIALGLYAYSTQLENGLLVTGMRDRISWGIYIASFVFFIGISHAGTLLSAILRAAKARWQLSITRMAELITVVALMVGALFPLIDLGRPDRILNVFFYGRWQSPLIWDILAISTYLTGSTLYLLLPLIPDFARARDRLGPTASRFRRTLFTLGAVGYRGTPAQRRALERAMTVMMIVIIPVAVSVHTVVSWIFAMTLRVPFNTTVFGPFFVAGAIYSGIAAIIVLMAVLRRLLHFEEFITVTQFKGLGDLLAAFTLIMGYFNLQEYAVHGYKLEAGMPFHFDQLMTGPFALIFWFYILGGIVLPGLLILNPRTRTIRGIVAAAVLALVAMWIERYLIVVAGLRVPLMPYLPADYFPSWVEWSILGGAFALFALIISVFAKLFPVISIWEVIEHRGPEPAPPPVDWRPRPARAPLGAGVLSVLAVVGSAAGLMLGGQAGADDRIGTQITASVPAAAALGQGIEARARLTDGDGRPIAKAVVAFSAQRTFLGTTDLAVLAETTTDASGVATAIVELRLAGTFEIRAVYLGDEGHAPAMASAPITITGDAQLYVQSAGVRVPGLNEAPLTGTVVLGEPNGLLRAVSGLWPALSGWPIALVLLTIWSLYFFVAYLVTGIARAADEPV